MYNRKKLGRELLVNKKGEISMQKRVSAILMIVLMFIPLITMTVVADVPNTEEVEPQYISTCDGGGKHLMVGKGSTELILKQGSNRTQLLEWAPVTQCTICYLILVTEENPMRPGIPWGIYATKSSNYPISSLPDAIECATYDVCTSINDPYFQGFEFSTASKSVE